MNKRRLSGLTPTPTDPNTTTRLQQTMHRTIVQEVAEPFGLVLSPAEMDTVIAEAAAFSQGVKNSKLAFRRYAKKWLDKLAADSPNRRRYSALADWMDDSMSDREKAMREAVAWLDNPKIAFFDTETTGLSDEDVPVTAAACSVEGISLLDIKFGAISDTGEVVHISAGAAKVNHLTDKIIATYPLLEDAEWDLIGLEGLMEQHFVLAGYFCSYDRQMISRALRYAFARVYAAFQEAKAEQDKDELDDMVKRLRALQDYYGNTANWLEVKPTLVTAIGLDPDDAQGKRTRLEDVGYATRALQPGQKEQHEALADCRLIVDCIKRMKEDLNAMANEKTAKKAAAPKPAAKPNSPFPPAANPAENEPSGPQPSQPSKEVLDYMNDLEKTVSEYQTANGELSSKLVAAEAQLETANARIAELEGACESYALESGGHRHHEARSICFTDIIVNGYPVNFTIREGYTPEEAVEDVFKHLRGLMLIQVDKRVTSFQVGKPGRSDFYEMKAKDQPADHPPMEQPAQPKGNGASKPPAPPAANKPTTPPPAAPKPAAPPPAGQPAQQGQPAGKPGKKLGDPEFRICNGLTRNETNGVSTYELPFAIGGKQAEWPLKIAKNDTANFEKFLQDCGWEPSTFDPGVTYSLNIRVDWERGKPVKADEPDGACFHNKSRFTLLMDQPA